MFMYSARRRMLSPASRFIYIKPSVECCGLARELPHVLSGLARRDTMALYLRAADNEGWECWNNQGWAGLTTAGCMRGFLRMGCGRG